MPSGAGVPQGSVFGLAILSCTSIPLENLLIQIFLLPPLLCFPSLLSLSSARPSDSQLIIDLLTTHPFTAHHHPEADKLFQVRSCLSLGPPQPIISTRNAFRQNCSFSLRQLNQPEFAQNWLTTCSLLVLACFESLHSHVKMAAV